MTATDGWYPFKLGSHQEGKTINAKNNSVTVCLAHDSLTNFFWSAWTCARRSLTAFECCFQHCFLTKYLHCEILNIYSSPQNLSDESSKRNRFIEFLSFGTTKPFNHFIVMYQFHVCIIYLSIISQFLSKC